MSFGGRIREIKQRLKTISIERQVLKKELNELILSCDHRHKGRAYTCPDCGCNDGDLDGW